MTRSVWLTLNCRAKAKQVVTSGESPDGGFEQVVHLVGEPFKIENEGSGSETWRYKLWSGISAFVEFDRDERSM